MKSATIVAVASLASLTAVQISQTIVEGYNRSKFYDYSSKKNSEESPQESTEETNIQ